MFGSYTYLDVIYNIIFQKDGRIYKLYLVSTLTRISGFYLYTV